MPIHTLTLLERRIVANQTIVLTFSKPQGFVFTAGQYGGFTLINPIETDANGITRRFSLLSTPDDDHIQIVTRLQSSAYKRVLNQLPISSQIKFAGPSGNFVLHEDSDQPAVMLAGGIGIAPFMSMIRHAVKHRPTQTLYLFYGNRSEADTAFLQELYELAAKHSAFKVIAAMEQPTAEWTGETGYINYPMIKKHVPDIERPLYYICGSLVMVNAIHELLQEMEINETQIRTEDFPGY